jgi:hypothetical protein
MQQIRDSRRISRLLKERNRKNWTIVIGVLAPFIQNMANSLANNKIGADPIRLEQAAYNEIYRYLNDVSRANGNLPAVVKALKRNAVKAMGSLLTKRAASVNKPFVVVQLSENTQVAVEKAVYISDRFNIAQLLLRLKKLDRRLALILVRQVNGKGFVGRGDRDYFYRHRNRVRQWLRNSVVGYDHRDFNL